MVQPDPLPLTSSESLPVSTLSEFVWLKPVGPNSASRWECQEGEADALSPVPSICPRHPSPYLRLGAAGVKAGLDSEVASHLLGCTAPATQVHLGALQWGQLAHRDQDLEVAPRAAHVYGHHWGPERQNEGVGDQQSGPCNPHPHPQSLAKGWRQGKPRPRVGFSACPGVLDALPWKGAHVLHGALGVPGRPEQTQNILWY